MKIIQVVNGHSWDSELTIGAGEAELTLIFRTKCIQVNPDFPSVGRLVIHDEILYDEGQQYLLHKWDYDEWGNFCKDLPKVIENAWNNKLWLFPSIGWYQAHPMAIVSDLYNVKCKVQIILTNDHPHVTFYCIKPGNSFVKIKNRGKNFKITEAKSFRSWADDSTHTSIITNQDLEPCIYNFEQGDGKIKGIPTNIHPYSTRQTTIAHEFGHILKLGHVNEHKKSCQRASDGNAEVCYGVIEQERKDIMGCGDVITPKHVKAWKNTIVKHVSPETKMEHHLKWEGNDSPFSPFPFYFIDGRNPLANKNIPKRL